MSALMNKYQPSNFITIAIIYIFLALLVWRILAISVPSKSLKFYSSLFFLLLIFIELLLRFFVPSLKTYTEKIGYSYISMYKPPNNTWYLKHGPNYIQERVQPEFSHIYKSNSLGIFAKEPNDINQKKHKILCLGDSFTEGVGAAQNESWPAILQQKLDEAYPDSFEVINAGIGGSDVFYMWKLYEDILKVYNPNQIIMFIGDSDLFDILVRGGDERFQQDSNIKYRNAPWFEPLFKSSYILRLIVLKILQYDFTLLNRNDFNNGLIESCKLIEAKFEEIELILGRDNIEFNPIIHPVPYEMERGQFKSEHFAKIADNKQYKGINFISKSKELGYKIPSDFRPYYWPIDGHYTPKGYHLIADIIFDIFYSKQKK
jgi:hypothetical protein